MTETKDKLIKELRIELYHLKKQLRYQTSMTKSYERLYREEYIKNQNKYDSLQEKGYKLPL
jgi:hypothetical protein